VENIILQSLMPGPPFVPSCDDLDDDTLLATAEQLETNKRKCEVDEDVPSYPSIDHCEGSVWKPALSRLRLNPEGDLCDQFFQLPPTTLCDEEDSTALTYPTNFSVVFYLSGIAMTSSAKDATSMIGTPVPIQSTVLTTRTCLPSNRKATSSTV